ncbi:aldo/keto reductase [Xylanimonas ulmi]|uniref:Aryl-alcohol dehydrogenase-like predicted oxidoreductase n=1 Tax=Xylanimonas ulmi TaxID=228973 RepID=A0A4Q7M4M2_9MICO|nr:aldo/keto reductase [Xylanibacterium ulmi]RZS61877.1 aryl-alcohol dehydrogenase-like predicted oxidoreductase [Xylanibacterium ulmi]
MVPPLGLGTCSSWDRLPQDERVAVVFRAVESGAGLFDVACCDAGRHARHSSGDIIFGAALWAAGIDRDDVVVCGGARLRDWPRRSLREQVEVSLERVGLERFDAVVLDDYDEPPDVRAVVTGVAALVDAGLVGSWGVFGWPAADTLAALDVAALDGLTPPTFVRLAYGVMRRAVAEGEPYADLFRAGTLGLQAVGALEGGVLAGGLPRRRVGAAGRADRRIAEVRAVLEAHARQADVTPAQLAIAFALAYAPTRNVLFAASRLAHVEANLAAIRLAADHGPWVRDALDGLALDDDVGGPPGS